MSSFTRVRLAAVLFGVLAFVQPVPLDANSAQPAAVAVSTTAAVEPGRSTSSATVAAEVPRVSPVVTPVATPPSPVAPPAAPPKSDKPDQNAEPARPASPPKPVITLAVDIDLSRQQLTVREYGKIVGSWAISSGREGYRTPTGVFRPSWQSKMWYSRKYDMSPMPHSVFFNGGVAMHATQVTHMLGYAASHGCIRQAPANAARMYALVSKHGYAKTRIVVRGTPRDLPAYARRNTDGDGTGRTARVNPTRPSYRTVYAPTYFAKPEPPAYPARRQIIVVDGFGNRRAVYVATAPRPIYSYGSYGLSRW